MKFFNSQCLRFIALFLTVHGNQLLAQSSMDNKTQVIQSSAGKIYLTTQTNPKYRIDSARYAIFIPQGVSAIRGVFIHQHGCTMEGRGMATAFDIQYQAFAKKWQLAIVGPDLYAKNNCHDWKDPASGSAAALFAALRTIGRQSEHPELNTAPWLLWGHSGGGYWSQAMLAAYPQRVLALFSYSPGLDAQFPYPPAALQVPVMIRHAGPVGDACCWQTAFHTFHELRGQQGLAAIAYTRFQNHNYSFVRYMAIPFFEAVMRQRLPELPETDYKAMRPMDVKKAWLGDTASLNIYPLNRYPGNPLSAAWLPDSIAATLWREYAITGTVVDHTPPPPPFGASIHRRHNMTVELKWKADADIGSGISHFNIYKGDQFVGRFPATGSYQQFDTNGDDAYPLNLPPLQTDISLPWNDSSKIYISTVNQFGLESQRTEAL